MRGQQLDLPNTVDSSCNRRLSMAVGTIQPSMGKSQAETASFLAANLHW